MKLTNFFLFLIICLLANAQLRGVSKRVTQEKTSLQVVSLGKVYTETKTVPVTSKNEENVKHSTTFRNYVDSDNRSNQSISHNIRINKDYYISGSVNTRQNSYGTNNVGVSFSATKYW